MNEAKSLLLPEKKESLLGSKNKGILLQIKAVAVVLANFEFGGLYNISPYNRSVLMWELVFNP